jgi:hypothetical protein
LQRTGSKEIKKAVLVLGPVGIGLLLIGTVCRADAENAIARCAAISSKDLRIACLEDALREGSRTAESIASSAEAEPHDEPPTPAVELGEEQVATKRASSDEDEKVVNATVVDFRFVGYRRLLVQLDNGQVWRQIDGDRTTVQAGLRNKSSFPVELWGAPLGGYRMRITSLNTTIRVERIK